jgi:hypothetical protein
MDFLSAPQQLYSQITKGMESIWLVVKPDPCGKNMYLYAQEIEPNEGWHIAEDIIRNAANRYSKFNICVAVNKNAIQTNIPVTVVHQYRPQDGQVAGIGAVPGVYGYGQHDIGKLLDERDEKWKKELEHRDEVRKLADQIAGLQYENQMKKKKGDFWEKATVFCQENEVDVNQIVGQIMPIISGVLSKIVMPNARATPALAGRPRPGTTHVHHHEATTEVPTELDTDEPDTDEGQPLTEDDYRALDALDMLKAAGAADPAGIMEKVAKFYQSNPAMAEGFINQYLPA